MNIDDAIDKWLSSLGFADAEIADLDYSTLNEELDFYEHELRYRRAHNEQTR
jgi:hypothetical protein